jgi:flavin-dependent dehydrogenase
MKPVTILGAGLSGLTAAITLAQEDYQVQVYEERSDSGMRFHGDFQGLENWSSPQDVLQEIKTHNIKQNFSITPFHTMYLTDGTTTFPATSSRPMFYLVKRGPFSDCIDQGLKHQALDLNVDIHYKSHKSIHDADIIATGPSTKKVTAIGKGIIFETDHNDLAMALVHKEASYKGYSYLLILQGHGCMFSICMYPCENINTYWKKTCELYEHLTQLTISNPKNTGGFVTFRLNAHLQKQGRRYTGEAAGLQDFLWGFGMRYALTSGYLAARSIIEKKSYKNFIRHHLSNTRKASIVNRYYVDKTPDYGRSLIAQGQKLKEGEHVKLIQKYYKLTLFSRFMYPYVKLSLLLSKKYS